MTGSLWVCGYDKPTFKGAAKNLKIFSIISLHSRIICIYYKIVFRTSVQFPDKTFFFISYNFVRVNIKTRNCVCACVQVYMQVGMHACVCVCIYLSLYTNSIIA